MSLYELQNCIQNSLLTEELESSLGYINEPESRLWIYLDAYQTRLIDALEKTFPLLRDEMGEKKFHQYALGYIKKHPSQYYSLSLLGAQFSKFVPTKYRQTAELDWAINIASESKESDPVTRADLEKIPPDQWGELVLVFQPSLSIVKNYRVWRKGRQVYTLAMAPQEQLFLAQLQAGKPLGEACEILYTVLPEEKISGYIIQQLLSWLDDEIISKENS